MIINYIRRWLNEETLIYLCYMYVMKDGLVSMHPFFFVCVGKKI